MNLERAFAACVNRDDVRIQAARTIRRSADRHVERVVEQVAGDSGVLGSRQVVMRVRISRRRRDDAGILRERKRRARLALARREVDGIAIGIGEDVEVHDRAHVVTAVAINLGAAQVLVVVHRVRHGNGRVEVLEHRLTIARNGRCDNRCRRPFACRRIGIGHEAVVQLVAGQVVGGGGNRGIGGACALPRVVRVQVVRRLGHAQTIGAGIPHLNRVRRVRVGDVEQMQLESAVTRNVTRRNRREAVDVSATGHTIRERRRVVVGGIRRQRVACNCHGIGSHSCVGLGLKVIGCVDHLLPPRAITVRQLPMLHLIGGRGVRPPHSVQRLTTDRHDERLSRDQLAGVR